METIGDLRIDQDIEFQRRAWRVERIGWGVIFLVIALGLLGLFSTGPLSSASAGNIEDGITLGYERFLRNEGEASLEITVAPDQVVDGKIRLWVNADYLDHTADLVVHPTPDEVRLDDSRQIFVFLTEPSDGPFALSISFQPEAVGRLSGDVGVVDGAAISFWQFSYP